MTLELSVGKAQGFLKSRHALLKLGDSFVRIHCHSKQPTVDGSPEMSSLDIATAIVAGYAALLATLAFAFNVFSWLRTWQTRLKVVLRRMDLVTLGGGDAEPVVLFDLTNRSAHKVKVTHVGLAPIQRRGAHIFIPHPLGVPVAGPFEIPPREAVHVWIKPEVLSEADPQRKTRALIKTSDGAEFESKRVRIATLLEDPS